ncbi:MAG: 4-hydroxy-3-methylbut-2-enyl diphosphate reductase [Zoogloeaceae bacterium]|jgi:4-hydroxy-3-methylbut-2-enyl diphosphate reductase|nr:4-hydroxy-3-methylbut-2-enyl diphosphate reductase [Zoogloeaceae bacterium]
MRILLANPRGFCAGVTRAIGIVERALEKFGAPVYVRHEVVHNPFVCDSLRAKGAVFIEEVDEAPPGGTLIFSAHGVSRAVRVAATRRGLNVLDATCPLVTKVHLEVDKMRAQGREVVMIGHKGHPEVEGTMGQSETGMYLVENVKDAARLVVAKPDALSFVTQTTLSVEDAGQIIVTLKQRFPDIRGPHKNDICYATQNRQDAVKLLAARCELVLVVGSPKSSNSRRLREVAASLGIAAHLVNSADEIDPAWIVDKRHIGVTAGASAPEILVAQVIEHLQRLSVRNQRKSQIEEIRGADECLRFHLPRVLADQGSGVIGN